MGGDGGIETSKKTVLQGLILSCSGDLALKWSVS